MSLFSRAPFKLLYCLFRRNKLGKYNEEEMANLAKEKEEQELEEQKRFIFNGTVREFSKEVHIADVKFE